MHSNAGFHMAEVVQIFRCPLVISVLGLHWSFLLLFCWFYVVDFFGFFQLFLISTVASAADALTMSTTDILCVAMCWFLPNLLVRSLWKTFWGRYWS